MFSAYWLSASLASSRYSLAASVCQPDDALAVPVEVGLGGLAHAGQLGDARGVQVVQVPGVPAEGLDGVGQPAPDGQDLGLGAARRAGQQFHLDLIQPRVQRQELLLEAAREVIQDQEEHQGAVGLPLIAKSVIPAPRLLQRRARREMHGEEELPRVHDPDRDRRGVRSQAARGEYQRLDDVPGGCQGWPLRGAHGTRGHARWLAGIPGLRHDRRVKAQAAAELPQQPSRIPSSTPVTALIGMATSLREAPTRAVRGPRWSSRQLREDGKR